MRRRALSASWMWPEVWSETVAAFGGCTGTLLLQGGDHSVIVASCGYTGRALELYQEYYHRRDVWAAFGRRHPKLRAVLGDEIVSQEAFERSEVWNDFSRPHVGPFTCSAQPFQLRVPRLRSSASTVLGKPARSTRLTGEFSRRYFRTSSARFSSWIGLNAPSGRRRWVWRYSTHSRSG